MITREKTMGKMLLLFVEGDLFSERKGPLSPMLIGVLGLWLGI